MLTKPEYMGHTVNFRSSKENYKDKSAKRKSSDEWIIFENTQEPIIDERTWRLAQKMCKTIRKTDSAGDANPLTGLLYCADCGARMYNHRGKNGFYEDKLRNLSDLQKTYNDHYSCSTYNNGLKKFEPQCSQHYISTLAVKDLILEAIRLVSQYAIENEEEFVQKVRENSLVKQKFEVKALQSQLKKKKKRCNELDGLIKKLYEAYATGKLVEKRFETLSAEYEQEQADLEVSIAKVQSDLDAYNADTNNVEQFMLLAKKYTDFSELTALMLNEYIDKILVHVPDRSNGERTQEVEIFFNFIGKFEVPQPEPTPEEIAAEEKRKQLLIKKRDYLREYRRKHKQRLLEKPAGQESQNMQV